MGRNTNEMPNRNYEVVDLAKKYNLSISYVYKILQNRG